uniref:Uncharacterized protein n=1 Tax=Hucho hucho TaxID=62062 RepID=A0A4W5PNV2_9TELE
MFPTGEALRQEAQVLPGRAERRNTGVHTHGHSTHTCTNTYIYACTHTQTHTHNMNGLLNVLQSPSPTPLSQARVYYEEALGVSVNGFSDLPLLIALYTNLTAVYLKQKMADKLPQTLEKASALLLCLSRHTFTSLDEFELLKLVLRRSVVEGDKHLEARACYLTASLFLLLRKIDDALPFVERLQFLTVTLSAEEGRPIAPLDLNWLLSRLYHRKYMPYLALASLSLDTGQDHSLQDAFHRIELFSRNSVGYGLFVRQSHSNISKTNGILLHSIQQNGILLHS